MSQVTSGYGSIQQAVKKTRCLGNIGLSIHHVALVKKWNKLININVILSDSEEYVYFSNLKAN